MLTKLFFSKSSYTDTTNSHNSKLRSSRLNTAVKKNIKLEVLFLECGNESTMRKKLQKNNAEC